MNIQNKKTIAYIGISTCIIYFLVVAGFLVYKTDALLTCWEVVTIFSAPVLLLILLCILNDTGNCNTTWRHMAIVFMGCTTTLTGMAHFVNITVTRRLLSEGYKVPDYLQIGKWPSLEMAVDYLAWGFFMGLSFLCASFAIDKDNSKLKKLKYTLFICGLLCLAGIVGMVLINENYWYIAPLGYGFGTIIICIEMILLNEKK